MQAAIVINGLCLGLFTLRWLLTGSDRYAFIPENILLAWMGFGFGWWLIKMLKTQSWKSWPAIALTVLWLMFIPNCWYVMTDFIHLNYTGEISQLYDIVMFNSLVASGFLAGFTSLLLVHKQILKRTSPFRAALIVLAVIVYSSFAIYLGRDLRWNSADVIANPGGLVLNVSDRLIDPFGRPRMVNVTSLFAVTIGAGYWAVWRLSKPRN